MKNRDDLAFQKGRHVFVESVTITRIYGFQLNGKSFKNYFNTKITGYF